jgi:hypothetical protein
VFQEGVAACSLLLHPRQFPCHVRPPMSSTWFWLRIESLSSEPRSQAFLYMRPILQPAVHRPLQTLRTPLHSYRGCKRRSPTFEALLHATLQTPARLCARALFRRMRRARSCTFASKNADMSLVLRFRRMQSKTISCGEELSSLPIGCFLESTNQGRHLSMTPYAGNGRVVGRS